MKASKFRTIAQLAALAALAACAPVPATEPIATETATPTLTPSPTATSTPTPTPRPTFTPTPMLAPQGKTQRVPRGIVYLGDKSTLALGFNMTAGGAIASLLYNGREFIDRTDYGRYIQMSLYDSRDTYRSTAKDFFGAWGWNPIQAGSKARKGAKVLEYRTSTDGIYIKAQGKEWGQVNQDSDVVFETWAWLRDGYFEIHIRATHTGEDSHGKNLQEFPAAYFDSKLDHGFGYFGALPFTGAPLDAEGQLGGSTSCPTVRPSEDWLAFGNEAGRGVILAMPPQPYLTGDWAFCFYTEHATPVGYTSPIALFNNPPGAVHESTFYLIPGYVRKGRALVYDLIPHTTWTFDLGSAESWKTDAEPAAVEGGILSASISPYLPLSNNNLRVQGATANRVDMLARARSSNARLCLYFLTSDDDYWSASKSTCTTLTSGSMRRYTFDFASNYRWNHSTITALALVPSKAVAIDMDEMRLVGPGSRLETLNR